MKSGLEISYDVSTYGEYEVLREDFAKMLEALHLEVTADVDIAESDLGANSQAVRDYAEKYQGIFVRVQIVDVPFYYVVKGNMAQAKLKGWFKAVEEGEG